MQSVDFKALADLDERFNQVLKAFPQRREELHKRIAQRLEREVRQQVYMSGVDSERIEGWQVSRFGSRGGYAAVSAISGRGPHGHKDSPGAITNYLENGHRIRPPGKTKGRAKVPYVNGYHFYAYARKNALPIAINEAELMLSELSRELGGAA